MVKGKGSRRGTEKKKRTTKTKTATKKPTAKTKKKTTTRKTAGRAQASTKRRATAKSVSPEERFKMIQEAAFYLAKNNEFSKEPREYWLEAERQIEGQLSK